MDEQLQKILDVTKRMIGKVNGNRRNIDMLEQGIASGAIEPNDYVVEREMMDKAFIRSWKNIVLTYSNESKDALKFFGILRLNGLTDPLFEFAQFIFSCAYHEGYNDAKKK